MRWHPGIGDPTFAGWLTVCAYAVAAALALRCFLLARRVQARLAAVGDPAAVDHRSMKVLWSLVAATMLILGVNKQLDLQTLLIQTVRRRAYVDGWYGERRRYQKEFIVAMAAVGMVAILGLAVWLRHVLARVVLVIAGLTMLIVFVLVRATSFHYVDKVLALGGRVRVNQALELGGIAVIIVAMLNCQRLERRDLLRANALVRLDIDEAIPEAAPA